ncbi:unnamed protein product [Oppiella nova]|uniref:Nuclear receptor domain-containing protein n=1 Tax=Oppiella nova TaxID=334625 RepID=A0A7R9QBQ7_9ACAR|nr:unnamed protein product [Oppiella nova]CAG2161708.1 unnamed protein product [Oppiella nova]
MCLICGDKAGGTHFGVITCESCKAFFRRNAIIKAEQFKCYLGGNCDTSVKNRINCKKCRLDKCFAVVAVSCVPTLCPQSSVYPSSVQSISTNESIIEDFTDFSNQLCEFNDNSVNTTASECWTVVPVMKPITDYSNQFNELEGNKLSELLDAIKVLNIPVVMNADHIVLNTIESASDAIAHKYDVDIRNTGTKTCIYKLDRFRGSKLSLSKFAPDGICHTKFLTDMGIEWDSEALN